MTFHYVASKWDLKALHDCYFWEYLCFNPTYF